MRKSIQEIIYRHVFNDQNSIQEVTDSNCRECILRDERRMFFTGQFSVSCDYLKIESFDNNDSTILFQRSVSRDCRKIVFERGHLVD